MLGEQRDVKWVGVGEGGDGEGLCEVGMICVRWGRLA